MHVWRWLLWVLPICLGGCDLLAPPPGPPPEPPAPSDPGRLIAERAIRSGDSAADDHLADLELWMDGGPTHPRIVLVAVRTLEYFEINLALPVCYVFPRPNQEMPGWRGGPLPAGVRVEIPSTWEQISDGCAGDSATVLWNLAAAHEGSKSKLSVAWDWPGDAGP